MSAVDHKVFLSVYGRTDVGMQRSGNEDAFLIADLTTGDVGVGPDVSTYPVGDRGNLLVVSDGMGGAVAGEVASELAVTTLRESMLEMPADFGAAEQLKIAAEIANERIWNHARQNPELTGMGATLTGVLVHEKVAYIAQVGDSRAYLIRGEKIKQLTRDQSLVQMLLDANAITPEQASQVPQNVIMQALGTQPVVKVVMSGVEICQNDYLLLCSDGLSNKVTQEELRQVVYESENINTACRRLIEIANERGGEDNITVVIARFDGDSLHSASDSLSITGSFVAIEETNRRITQRDLTDIDTSEAASVTTLVVPSFSKPEEEEIAEEEETPTDRLDAAQVAGFDEVPTTRLELPAVESEQADSGATETPITKTFSSKKEKKSFGPILLFALVAAALLAATFLFYKFYFQKQAAPPPAPPASDQIQQSQPSNADQPQTNQTEAAPTAEPTPEGGRPQLKQISPDSTSEKKDPNASKAQDNSNRD
ncbi:MAG: Stp1/IreP family PP2C-type Ser/Thr phosphatase [Acidobacteriota bacterium]